MTHMTDWVGSVLVSCCFPMDGGGQNLTDNDKTSCAAHLVRFIDMFGSMDQNITIACRRWSSQCNTLVCITVWCPDMPCGASCGASCATYPADTLYTVFFSCVRMRGTIL
jgi:hypothetical protein